MGRQIRCQAQGVTAPRRAAVLADLEDRLGGVADVGHSLVLAGERPLGPEGPDLHHLQPEPEERAVQEHTVREEHLRSVTVASTSRRRRSARSRSTWY